MGGRVAIVGLGVTGLSVLRYFCEHHSDTDILVLDTRAAPPGLDEARALVAGRARAASVQIETSVDGWRYGAVDRVVVSPGITLDSCLVRGAVDEGAAIESDIDLFLAEAAVQGTPVIGVTGTNGKSTVTSLAGHLLANAGVRVAVGGNLGDAALQLLSDEIDAYVLELSSFQLERLREPHFLVATVLNVTEDHLDRHANMADYAATKQRIYHKCRTVVWNRDDIATRPAATQGADVTLASFGLSEPVSGVEAGVKPGALAGVEWGVRESDGPHPAAWLSSGDTLVAPVAELPLAGQHNVANALAACALVDACLSASATDGTSRSAANMDPAVLRRGLASFRGLAHRCELVAEHNGVRWINDSKATNVGAAVAALQGLGGPGGRPIILIAGGDGKGADFAPLARYAAGIVRHAFLLGVDKQGLAAALGANAVPFTVVADLEEAVAGAVLIARAPDVVLLSPACASLDMFRNFAERGERFAALAVQHLGVAR